MNQIKTVRRAVAKVRHDEAADAIPHVGHKPVHHFWPLLSPRFRDVLVAPHHRTDEDAVTWTWREPEDAESPSAAELGDFRRRLAGAMERFAQDVAGGRVGRGSSASAAGLAGSVEQLEAVMGAMVRELTGRRDAELKRFVCRTENGLRVHSWGAGAPACPSYPDTHGLEIAGCVLVAGQPARHDVVLESSDGETIAEVPSDEAGEFSFSKLSPGEYRLRARSVRGTFPPHGLPVELTQRSVKGIVLADGRADAVSPLVSARRAAGRRSRRTWPLVALGALAVAGGGWGWQKFESRAGRPAAAGSTPAEWRSGAVDRSAAEVLSPVRTAAAGGTAPGVGIHFSGPGAGRRTMPAPEPKAFAVEGGDPGAGGRPPSSAGGAGGGGGPAFSDRAVGAGAAGSPSVSTDSVRSPAPALSPPAVVADGGSPSGPPPEPAVAGAPAAGGPPPLPAPAAPAAAANAPAASPSVAPVPAPVALVAAPAGSTPDVVAAPAVVAVPAEPTVSPPEPVVARTPEDSVSTTTAEVSRDTAAPAVAPVTVSVRASAAETENVNPPETGPVAESTTVQPASGFRAPVVVQPFVVRTAPAPLTRTVRVRVSPWRTRLLVDTILPTAPTPLSQPEPVELLRARLLAEQEARLPRAFIDAEGRLGVAFELNAELAEASLGWLDSDASRPEFARVSGNRAEVMWTASPAEGERVFGLSRRDGSLVAEVRVAANGRDFSVWTTEEVRTWLKLAVRIPAPDRGAGDVISDGQSFSWRNASAAPLPPGWREGGHAGEPDETVVQAPLGRVEGAAALQACALFDAATGWAILADVRQAADRPLGQ